MPCWDQVLFFYQKVLRMGEFYLSTNKNMMKVIKILTIGEISIHCTPFFSERRADQCPTVSLGWKSVCFAGLHVL